ncbi:MAG: metallophosphoesterase [Thermodesulfobacteriota bacterium]|nr:metallophosphoesterase [Thermodesulfobacteriota bacterium]
MTLFFAIVLSVFLLIVAFQWVLIRFILPEHISGPRKTVIAIFIASFLNTIPFLYMAEGAILDQLPWWHRELIVSPYAVILVASAFSGLLFMALWSVTAILRGLWPQFEKSRRGFLGNSARTLMVTSIGALGYGTYWENKGLEISKVTLKYEGLHPELSGLKIVQLTDFHAGPFISFEAISHVVSAANALKPDLIVLTGDYVNHNPAYIHGCVSLLDDLKAPAGVFGVYGNHDHYTGIGAMKEAFSKTHLSMLSDGRGTAKGLEGRLNIIGVEDPVSGWATDARFSTLAKISGLVVPGQFNLLLSHRPGIFKTSQDWHVPLTLSGHTHGGQVIVPAPGGRGFSLASFFVTYTHGLYESKPDSQVRLYVSRGIGTIVAPVRLFCPPEIVEITLAGA